MVDLSGVSTDFPNECKGLYSDADGRRMFFGNLFGAPHVAWHDLSTGLVRALYPKSDNRYITGPSLFSPEPIEREYHFFLQDGEWKCEISTSAQQDAPQVVQRLPVQKESVEFSSGEVLLAGTLFLPVNSEERRLPLVVLVHGSGPQMRHMVQLYAEVLCDWGYAAFAYDKRGAGQSTGDWQAGYDALAADALTAVHLLQQDPRIDPQEIGLMGGSQAGWIMPMAAVQSDAVAFIVMLAGPAVSIAQQNVHSVLYNLRANHLPESEIEEAVAHVKLFNRVLCTGDEASWASFQRSLEKGRNAAWSDYAWNLDKPPDKETARSIRAEMERDPLPTLQQIKCPLLAIFGTSDNVVPPRENATLMADAFLEVGKTNYKIEIVPEATHIFTKSATGADHEFPDTTHMDLKHLTIVKDWLADVV